MRAGSRDPLLVKSAVRAVEVLELFSRERRPLTLSAIIEALGYPQSSTTVILKSLVAIGYLNYSLDRKTYYPNVTVTRLGDWMPEAELIGGPLQRLMHALQERTTESVLIAVQNDINIHFLSVLNSNHAIKFFIPSRGQRMLLQSNLGWALLAAKSDKEIAALYGQLALADPGRTPPLDELMRRVATIRRDGYAFIPNLPVQGAASVAMLLPCRFHHAPIAIGIGGYVPRLEAGLPQILQAMRQSIGGLQDAAAA